MPTPAERKALLFFTTVLVLGALTRAYRTLHSRSPADAKARSALELQIKAADSAQHPPPTPAPPTQPAPAHQQRPPRPPNRASPTTTPTTKLRPLGPCPPPSLLPSLPPPLLSFFSVLWMV